MSTLQKHRFILFHQNLSRWVILQSYFLAKFFRISANQTKFELITGTFKIFAAACIPPESSDSGFFTNTLQSTGCNLARRGATKVRWGREARKRYYPRLCHVTAEHMTGVRHMTGISVSPSCDWRIMAGGGIFSVVAGFTSFSHRWESRAIRKSKVRFANSWRSLISFCPAKIDLASNG